MRITDFLEARIAEDEAAANLTLDPGHLHPYGDTRIPAIKPGEWGGLVQNYLGGPMGDHCARHNPTRVLAECAAKRVMLHNANYTALNSLAAVYADHPDYRQWT